MSDMILIGLSSETSLRYARIYCQAGTSFQGDITDSDSDCDVPYGSVPDYDVYGSFYDDSSGETMCCPPVVVSPIHRNTAFTDSIPSSSQIDTQAKRASTFRMT